MSLNASAIRCPRPLPMLCCRMELKYQLKDLESKKVFQEISSTSLQPLPAGCCMLNVAFCPEGRCGDSARCRVPTNAHRVYFTESNWGN